MSLASDRYEDLPDPFDGCDVKHPVEKSSEFYFRGRHGARLGFRVWRCHTARNMRKSDWLEEAVTEKLDREEHRLPPL